MNRKKELYRICLGVASGILVACSQSTSQDIPDTQVNTISDADPREQVLHGEYLVTIMGCNDCHSPKVFGPNGPAPDPERLLSGHPAAVALEKVDTTLLQNWVLFHPLNTAAVGPWGASFAANITSDVTGVGNWTEEQFIRAMREGKTKGLANNRNMLPPMPWPNFINLKDEDLKAIFAYLKSTKPVNNVVPPPMRLKDISE